jgi:outer membrane protein assembly factor BamB
VYALAAVGERIYIGGSFTSVNGQSRSRLAMVDSATGALDPKWVPAASDRVRAVVPSLDGTRIYVGGSFSSISGQSRSRLGAVDPDTGAVQSWRPSTSPNGLVYNLVEFNGSVYTAEDGTGGAVAAYTTSTGRRTWSQRGDGDVQAVAVLGNRLYAGGHFLTLGGQSRRFFAALDPATGALDPAWRPSGSGGAGVWSLVADPPRGRLYAGGDFTSISGQPQQGFAQFSE